jgi:FixJ family two-component response regulator
MDLDVSLPGLNGHELQKRISVEQQDMPIIFVTGHGDIPMTVLAMKQVLANSDVALHC